MDFEELKLKFQSKATADVKDINLALRATPFLVREVISLQEALAESELRIQHLTGMLKRTPPTQLLGKKDQAAWKIWIDGSKNYLHIQLFGKIEKKAGKLISNAVLSVMENLHSGFSVVVDVREMLPEVDCRTRFYFRKTAYVFFRMEAEPIVQVQEDSQNIEFLFENPEKQSSTAQIQERIHRVRTLEEADKLLDNLGRHLRS